MNLSSPEYLQISLAAAMTLGLRPGRFYRGSKLHCLNLLLTYPEGCYASCSYCGLSRNGSKQLPERSFIRVEWPLASLEEIMGRAKQRLDQLERICISMIMHPRAVDHTLFLIERLQREVGLPISVLVNPSTLKPGDLLSFQEAGADMATVAIDAATRPLFEQHRGPAVGGPLKWQRYWHTLEEAAQIFGKNKFGVHLIVGLGESEREILHAIQMVRHLKGRTHLFSFYPEEGSLLMEAQACPAAQFRRVQLGRFIIDYDLGGYRQMQFDEQDRIIGFGIDSHALDGLVQSGEPFQTGGCPGKTRLCACNRPFGDGPPSDIRSYPFKLEPDDVRLVEAQLYDYA